MANHAKSTHLEDPPAALEEAVEARICAMRLRIYPTPGQTGRMGCWLHCSKKFRNEAVAFCNHRRKTRAIWMVKHPVLAKEGIPEEISGSDVLACSKWLTERLGKARERVRIELGIACRKQDTVERVSLAFSKLSRGEQAEITDGWLLQVPRTVLDQVLQDMKKTETKAQKDRKEAKKNGSKSKKKLAGFPTFRKWQYPGSVRMQVNAKKNNDFRDYWSAGELFVPGLGVLKFRDQNFELPLTTPSLITVARDASGNLHASFLCIEKEYHQIKPNQATLLSKPLPLDTETGFPLSSGIDLSLTHLGVDDQGNTLGRKRHLKRYQNKLRYLNKSLARKQKGSNGWHKAKQELGSLHVKVANCREAELRIQAKEVVNKTAIVCLEDYYLAFMLQNCRLSASAHDASLGKFKLLIAQECQKQGKLLIKCGKFDASTQICSSCNFKNTQLKNDLTIRTWACPQCKTLHDRDQNAAINILIMALERAIENQGISHGKPVCHLQKDNTGPENGLGMLNSRLVPYVLHPELSTFVARGGLTAILEHVRSKVCHKVDFHLGHEGAEEARVDPVKPIHVCRERA